MTEGIVIGLLALLALWAVLSAVRRLRRGSACCGEREAGPARVAVKDRNRAHYPFALTLSIGGMTCAQCARRVENALNSLDGVWATVSIDRHSAAIRTKAPPDEAALRRAVQQAGYAVLRCERAS